MHCCGQQENKIISLNFVRYPDFPMKALSTTLIVIVFFAASCSKPGSGQSDTDSTSASTGTTPAIREASLNPEQRKRIETEIFLSLHNGLIDDEDWDESQDAAHPFAYLEEFRVDGNSVYYKLLRHNGPDAVEIYNAEVPDEDVRYMNVVDTLIAEFTFIAYEDTPWDGTNKKVKIAANGDVVFRNDFNLHPIYGTPTFEPTNYPIQDILVDLNAPLTVPREQLYAKARVADLEESDIAGLTKDELGYLRNEIFARHGHIFKTEKMNNYFGKMSWYYGFEDDGATLMNAIEKRNVDFIKKREG